MSAAHMIPAGPPDRAHWEPVADLGRVPLNPHIELCATLCRQGNRFSVKLEERRPEDLEGTPNRHLGRISIRADRLTALIDLLLKARGESLALGERP